MPLALTFPTKGLAETTAIHTTKRFHRHGHDGLPREFRDTRRLKTFVIQPKSNERSPRSGGHPQPLLQTGEAAVLSQSGTHTPTCGRRLKKNPLTPLINDVSTCQYVLM